LLQAKTAALLSLQFLAHGARLAARRFGAITEPNSIENAFFSLPAIGYIRSDRTDLVIGRLFGEPALRPRQFYGINRQILAAPIAFSPLR